MASYDDYLKLMQDRPMPFYLNSETGEDTPGGRPLPYQTGIESEPYEQAAKIGNDLFKNMVDEISGEADRRRQLEKARMMLEGGTISQGNALDFNPMLKGVMEGTAEMTGIAPSARLMTGLSKLQSTVLRPQSAFEWADYGAGMASEAIQTGLAGVDLAAIAPIVGKRAATSLANEIGQIGSLKPALRLPDGSLYTGNTHGDAGNKVIDFIQKNNIEDPKLFKADNWEPGFLDDSGKFVTRKEVNGLHSVRMEGGPAAQVEDLAPKDYSKALPDNVISEILRMSDLFRPRNNYISEFSNYAKKLEKEGFKYLDVYHLTNTNENEIIKNGLKGSESDFIGRSSGNLRPKSVYAFLDPDDIIKGIPGITGIHDSATEANLVHLKIPIERIKDIYDDGNFNLSTGTYSAIAIRGDLDKKYINSIKKIKIPTPEEYKNILRESGGKVDDLAPKNYKQQLLDEQQKLIDKIGAIKNDYDRMIAESDKILKTK